MACGKAELTQVFEDVFVSRTWRKQKTKDATLETASAALLVDPEEESYQAKMGRWVRDAVAAVRDDKLWFDMYIGSRSRAPVSHLLHWLQASEAASYTDLITLGPTHHQTRHKHLMHISVHVCLFYHSTCRHFVVP